MSDHIPPSKHLWITGPPEFDSDTEDTKDITHVPERSGIRNPKPYHTGYPKPYWDKRRLSLLYEKITAPNRFFDEAMVRQLEEKTTKTIRTLIYSEDGKKNLLYNFEWKVLSIGQKGGLMV